MGVALMGEWSVDSKGGGRKAVFPGDYPPNTPTTQGALKSLHV